ncbi:MAG: LptF/LptG family permease [Planctomycetota bacterium]
MRIGGLQVGGRLDRYVAWLFVKSYLAAFFLVVGLYLIMDMAAKLDEYLGPGKDGSSPPGLDVVRLYALQLPFLYLSMSPFVTLVAGLFTAAKMTRFNEVVAALNSGASVRRLFLPVFGGAALLAAGMFGLREWATEEIGICRDALLDRLEKRRPAPIFAGFSIRDRQGRSIRIDEFRWGGEHGEESVLEGLVAHFPIAGGTCRILAERAWPLPPAADGRWRLEGGRRIVTGEAQVPSTLATLEELSFTPEDVRLHWKGRENPLDLSFSETRRLLERDPGRPEYRTLFHYHLTFPLAGLVLLAVGLPFLLGQERGRAVERVALGLFLCVAYFGMDCVTRTLGLQGHLGPIHAAWLPVTTFASLGAVLTGGVRS